MGIISRIKQYTLLEWLLFGIILSMNSPWFIWAYNLSSIVQYSCVILSFIILAKEKRLRGNNRLIVFLLLIIYFVVGQSHADIHLSYIFICLSFLVSARIMSKEANNVINITTNFVFLSIIIPLPIWLIHQYIYPIPVIGIIDTGVWKGGADQLCENHLFFVTVQGLEITRFYSWYDEPGVLGTLAAFVLWANKFNLKDYRLLTILIGSLFTFSMAFYVLTIIGWIYNIKSTKKLAISGILLCFIGYLAFSLKENQTFQQVVINRVLNPYEYGIDTRTTNEIEMLWRNGTRNNSVIFGLGSGAMNKYGGISRSYKSFILEFGYVGFVLLVFSYFSLIRRKNIRSLFTLLLFVLAFLQRPQMFTAYEFVLFSCIVAIFAEKKDKLQSFNITKYEHIGFCHNRLRIIA